MTKFLGVFGLLIILTGCASSPEPDYYTLSQISGDFAPDINVSLQIDRPTLPGYLDRPEIVTANGDEISFDEMQRWAAPLDTMIEDILARDLRQRLPASVITTEEDDLTAHPPMTVDIEIQSFNATNDGANLKAQIFVSSKPVCGVKTSLSFLFASTALNSDGPQAQSVTIAQMADALVKALRVHPEVFCAPPAQPDK